MREELGDLNDTEAVDKVLSVAGLNVIDVGCGAGDNSRELVGRGATVLGVEPDPVQAEKNRGAPDTPGLRFVETGATTLPADDGSVDGLFFFRSLHHIPIADMDGALAEATRVLKRDGGFVYAVEPAMTGTFFPVMRPFNDETIVRTEAQAALARASETLFSETKTYVYKSYPRFDSFEIMVSRMMGMTFNKIDQDEIETHEVRALFEAGRGDDGTYSFDQPMLVNVFRGIR
jgi:ubiquinone/menaquinone biosynthesis C-methylase UbiE